MRLQQFPHASAYIHDQLNAGVIPGVCISEVGLPHYIHPCLTYVAMHVAMQRLLQIGPHGSLENKSKPYSYRALDYIAPSDGPYYYL